MLVTDFSSNSFEMAYLDKPSVIFVPGIDYVSKYMTHYNIKKLTQHEHMVYSNSISNTCQNIKACLDVGRVSGLANKVFDYVDQDNTKRLLQYLIKLK